MNPSVDRVRDALAELIKAALVSDDHRSLAFRREAAARIAVLAADPPEAADIRIDGAWTLAVRAAEAPALQPEEGRVSLTLPQASPFTLEDLTRAGFDVDGAVERIRKSASTG
ncbi:hypothetical protein [Methylorubrum zatmanii]|uniref:Uncharacterized protein n=1 Tax=Methylorubrum zatmanii TaxID=29429 RepID=A0ABW1WLM5_9HYPH|nr:hypothetical protein [Methylorubrum zatmanii]MBD8908223.1 hypothetical protein [Methylorubrum zatmanii]